MMLAEVILCAFLLLSSLAVAVIGWGLVYLGLTSAPDAGPSAEPRP